MVRVLAVPVGVTKLARALETVVPGVSEDVESFGAVLVLVEHGTLELTVEEVALVVVVP